MHDTHCYSPENNDQGPPPQPPPPGKGTQQGPPRTDGKLPRPPIQTFLFWLLILVALPLALVFIMQRQQPEQDTLTQGTFEKYLMEDRIRSITVVKAPTDIRAVEGRYVPSEFDPDAPEAELRAFRAEVIYTPALDSMIRDHVGEQREAKSTDNLWKNILVSLLPILLLVGLIYFLFSRQLRAAGKGALQFGKSRARLMSPTQERVTFADVAGVDEAKEEVLEIVEFLSAPEKFRNIGGRIPKGVLMVGPPGTGKTLLARAIAGEAGVPFFSISGSDFVEMFVGVGASRVRDMFQEGKRHAPCLVFIDEIDAVGRSRFSGIGGGHDEREQTLNALLSEMDGFEPNAGIIVLAATNRPDVLDPALLRPGRFDRRITVDLPDIEGRRKILEIHAKSIKLKKSTNLNVIAKGTPGFSGADLANLINEAALHAARTAKKAADIDDLEEARDKVRWGKERRSRTMDEGDRQVTAYHEAGHTLVGLHVKHATPLHKVTIIPRGQAYLGATMSLPEKDRYTQRRSEIEDEIAKLMGGRLAEQLIFGEITTGAAMDLKQSTEIARRMVCEWGMSESLGPLSYGHREEHIYLGRDITRSEDYSEETAREIDQEIRHILDKGEQRAQAILTENIGQLRLLGETLLEQETLGADDIRTLLGIEIPEPSDGHSTGGEVEAPKDPLDKEQRENSGSETTEEPPTALSAEDPVE